MVVRGGGDGFNQPNAPFSPSSPSPLWASAHSEPNSFGPFPIFG